MTYLLDVNVLIALVISQHEFHSRVERWVASVSAPAKLATCAITELGFVRIVAQIPSYGVIVSQAKTQLVDLKSSSLYSFVFLNDSNDISKLPSWADTPRRTTDGHLAQLAISHGAILATLDENIPDAFLIP